MSFTRVSKEAEEVLMEILEHEHDSDYGNHYYGGGPESNCA